LYFKLNGPHCPLECRYNSFVNISRGKLAKIELDSFNFACIDADPQDKYSRLMVSSHIRLNSNANGLLLRKTCLLPKLRGLPSIITLIFAPKIELNVMKQKHII
jgi:hypothetical protein